jgi:hypothetical protein
MRRAWLPRSTAGVLLALALLLPACDGPPVATTAEDIEQRLVGSWVREYQGDGVRSRRILVLAADRTFRETVRVTDHAGAPKEFLHEGTWFYDGTNLKRKYTLVNGEPPSRLNLPFVTFQIEFRSRNEFVGVDHIHRNRIEYRRVQPETEL